LRGGEGRYDKEDQSSVQERGGGIERWWNIINKSYTQPWALFLLITESNSPPTGGQLAMKCINTK
jgi:hypothetical protein